MHTAFPSLQFIFFSLLFFLRSSRDNNLTFYASSHSSGHKNLTFYVDRGYQVGAAFCRNPSGGAFGNRLGVMVCSMLTSRAGSRC